MRSKRRFPTRSTATVTAAVTAAVLVSVLAPAAAALPLPLPAAGAEPLAGVGEGVTVEGPLVQNVSLPTLK
jgi:hypothetical protein